MNIIEKEKVRQEEFSGCGEEIHQVSNCGTGGYCWDCGMKREVHKQSLINLKEYMEEELKKFIIYPIDLAKDFHYFYEEMAKISKWETQESCKVKWDDLPESNKKTMELTSAQIIAKHFMSRESELKIHIKELTKLIEDYND